MKSPLLFIVCLLLLQECPLLDLYPASLLFPYQQSLALFLLFHKSTVIPFLLPFLYLNYNHQSHHIYSLIHNSTLSLFLLLIHSNQALSIHPRTSQNTLIHSLTIIASTTSVIGVILHYLSITYRNIIRYTNNIVY